MIAESTDIKFKKSFVIGIILMLGFIYHSKYINEFPSHIHAWAQSDRYALALGFQNNGLNFFKPETFVYNHQFPNDFKIPSEHTITAVDFPIHDYLVGVMMKVTGNDSPWLFRIYVLLYSFFGLYYLYKLTFKITSDYFKSVLIMIFAATSPVFVYYQSGFLPSIPSLSNAIIGIYFYYSYLQEKKNRDFNLGIFFLTLATLSRSTFAIPLLAVLGCEFIRLIRKETALVPKLIPVFISISSIFFYMLYNNYLRNEYGSIFLNHLLPAENFEDAFVLINQVYDNWKFQYLTKWHYLFSAGVFSIATILFFIQKKRLSPPISYFILLTSVFFIGCILFFILMMKQMPAHDYYFLDTFYLPILMMLIVFVSFITFNKQSFRIVAMVLGGIISVGMMMKPLQTQEKRRESGSWDKTATTIVNFSDASEFLDSLDISKDAKLLVLDPVAPNIPFIFMKRKGMVILTTSKENLIQALKWKYDYIIIQNEFFVSDIFSQYPEILSRILKIADNGKISICKLSEKKVDQDLMKFLDLENKKPLIGKMNDFESEENTEWQNYYSMDTISHSGKSSGLLTPSIEFGLTYKSFDLKEFSTSSRIVLFSGWFSWENHADCELIVTLNKDGKSLFYKAYNLKYLIQKNQVWSKVTLTFHVPKIEEEGYEFGIYLWNIGKTKLWYDDFSFAIY